MARARAYAPSATGKDPGAAPATRRAASTRSAATAATDACAERCSASAFKKAAWRSASGRRKHDRQKAALRSASSVRDEQFTHSASARGWARKKRSGRCLVGDGGAADPSSKTEAPSHESLPLRTIDGGSSSSLLTSARPAKGANKRLKSGSSFLSLYNFKSTAAFVFSTVGGSMTPSFWASPLKDLPWTMGTNSPNRNRRPGSCFRRFVASATCGVLSVESSSSSPRANRSRSDWSTRHR